MRQNHDFLRRAKTRLKDVRHLCPTAHIFLPRHFFSFEWKKKKTTDLWGLFCFPSRMTLSSSSLIFHNKLPLMAVWDHKPLASIFFFFFLIILNCVSSVSLPVERTPTVKSDSVPWPFMCLAPGVRKPKWAEAKVRFHASPHIKVPTRHGESAATCAMKAHT